MPYAQDERPHAPAPVLSGCPYHDRHGVCRASFSALPVDRRRIRSSCGGEDHDLCPLFLSKVLRSSRPRYCGGLRHEFADK